MGVVVEEINNLPLLVDRVVVTTGLLAGAKEHLLRV